MKSTVSTDGIGEPGKGCGRPAAALLLAVIGLGLTSGCHNLAPKAQGATIPTVPLPEDANSAPAVSQKVDLKFYLDASGSMKNYLGPARPGQTPNYYEQALNKLRPILTQSWEGKFTFWKFGKGEPVLLPDNDLSPFRSPQAYTYPDTYINEAITHNPKSLSAADPEWHPIRVILTDLYQNEDGAGELARLLDANYLNQEKLAVGVLGIRNAFHGKPDIKGAAADGADSMPIYFLIAGHAPDVYFLIDQLKQNLKLPATDYFQIVFGREPNGQLVRKWQISQADKKKVTEDDRMVPGAAGKFPVLTYVRRDVTLTIEQPGGGAGLSPYLQPSIHPKITAMTYRNGKGTDDPKAAEELTLPEQVDPKNLQLTIHRAKMQDKTMYRFRIDLVEGWDKLLTGLEPWSIDSVQELNNGRFPEERGHRPGKTLSLGFFLNVLRLKMRLHPTPIARYYLYAETN